MTEEERLINLYEALGYCDVYETKENIYDIVQKDYIKVLCEEENGDFKILRIKVDINNFNISIPLLTVFNDKYMVMPSLDFILINNTIFISNKNKRLFTVILTKIK